MSTGLYIHIPFCVSKCAYCDFYSLACGKNGQNELKSAYTASLCRQSKLWGKIYGRPSIQSIYIGGGTPTILPTKQLTDIIANIKSSFDISPNAEFTVEANPATFDSDKLKALKNAGVNRLSIGMQSANDNELKLLSRIHSENDTERSFAVARECGFDNISLDIMYGIPDQTTDSFKRTLYKAVSLSPEHISVYGLQLEPGTRLFNNQSLYAFPEEDCEAEMNGLAQIILESSGYRRYEISNYSLPGRECAHNLLYWNGMEYLGLGTGACSYRDRRRFRVITDIKSYCASQDFTDVTKTDEILTEEDAAKEYIMLRLRLCRGLELKKLYSITPNAEKYLSRARGFIKAGFIEENGGYIRFTPKGFNVSNTLLSEILF